MKALLVLPFLMSNILFASNLPLLTELDDIKINKYPKIFEFEVGKNFNEASRYGKDSKRIEDYNFYEEDPYYFINIELDNYNYEEYIYFKDNYFEQFQTLDVYIRQKDKRIESVGIQTDIFGNQSCLITINEAHKKLKKEIKHIKKFHTFSIDDINYIISFAKLKLDKKIYILVNECWFNEYGNGLAIAIITEDEYREYYLDSFKDNFVEELILISK